MDPNYYFIFVIFIIHFISFWVEVLWNMRKYQQSNNNLSQSEIYGECFGVFMIIEQIYNFYGVS